VGDHIWWIGSNAAFQADYPEWKQVYDVPMILTEIYQANVDKWVPATDAPSAEAHKTGDRES
jgi:CDP-paratose 2-epimerase